MPENMDRASSDLTVARALKQFASSKSAWSDIRNKYIRDVNAVNVEGGQWDAAVRAAREDDGRPALEFNELHTYVQQITNRARQERPQPKINPGEGGNPELAEMLEGKIRHIQYASQADIAYDNAVEGSASGGFGFYRITREYIGERSFVQEPRVRRILDPTTVYFDPGVLEPDYSDAKYCFVRQRMTRAEFKDSFHKEPSSFEGDTDPDWGDEDNVWIAEYWHVESRQSTLCQMQDGSLAFEDELEAGQKDEVLNSRPVTEKTVWCDIIDGEKVLETSEWPGAWIPIIPVLGREVVVEGKRLLISAVRFAIGSQKLKNAYGSGIAEAIGTWNHTPFIGWKGAFKDPKWRDKKRHFYYEAEPITINGTPAELPHRDTAEAPIQALTAAFLQSTDNIKRAVGYVDNVTRPSQGDISGVAVDRREQQQDLTNYHILDNLVRSQWHAGRVMLDLLLNLTDTPRPMQTMKEDGSTQNVPVTMQMDDGTVPEVPGYEGQTHHRIDVGQYDVTISTGPSYPTKQAEEQQALARMAEVNPNVWPLYGDLIWEKMGYTDLAERAKLGLAPAVQQAISQNGKPDPHLLQAQVAQLNQQNQMLKTAVEKAIQQLQTKQIEAEGRLKVEQLKAYKDVTVEQLRTSHETNMAAHHAGHEMNQAMLDANMRAVENLTQMLHDSEMAPDPNAAPKPKAA